MRAGGRARRIKVSRVGGGRAGGLHSTGPVGAAPEPRCDRAERRCPARARGANPRARPRLRGRGRHRRARRRDRLDHQLARRPFLSPAERQQVLGGDHRPPARRRRRARPRPARHPDPQDLTLFHQPIAQQIGSNGYTTTLGELMFRALTESDNTANDAVLRRAGGPAAVRAMLERNRLDGIRFGPGERLLQAALPACNGSRLSPRATPSTRRATPSRLTSAGRRSSAISTIRSTARRRTESPPASLVCSAANCSRRNRPSGC